MTHRIFKYEGWLYALAFILALSLRLLQLGAMPLTDAEALPALTALQISQGLKPALTPQPFYILSTAVLFFIYGGGTNFLARLISALAGSLLVLTPLLFKDRLKPRPSLILTFFLAMDAGMLALSRQAGGSMPAILFLFAALGFVNKRNPRWAGVFAALALLSGPTLWAGVLSFGLAWALYQAFEARTARAAQEAGFDLRGFAKEAALPFAAVLLVCGTLFFIVPNGLSAALQSLPAYISAWRVQSGAPATRMLASLLIYQPAMIVLALIALIRGWLANRRRIIPLSIAFLASLLVVVFLPSRQMADLGWALIPLLAMAALELSRYMTIFREERAEVAGVTFLVIFIIAFGWLDFAGLIWNAGNPAQYALRFWLLAGSLVLLALSLVLVAAGWSIRTAQLGGVWGITIALGVFGLGGALGAANLRGVDFPELWRPPATPAQAALLAQTVSDLSEWGLGEDTSAPVIILGIDSPALEWALRDHPVQTMQTLDMTTSPYIVISPLQTDPALAAAYRGQDFTWRETPAWETAQPGDWMRWLALRTMPGNAETIILWAREDMFISQ